MALQRYHLGLPVWNEQRWVGEFYSQDAKQREYLQQYATVFNAVEGNSTFYGLPAEKTMKKWADDVPKGFKFCFKVPQTITHYRKLQNYEDKLSQFKELLDAIRPNVGPVMIQLPAQFGPNQLHKLEAFLGSLPSVYNYGVEVRHPSLFDNGRNERALTNLLQSYSADRIIFDTRRLHEDPSQDPDFKSVQDRKPELPVRFTNTSSHPMVRFVGSNDVESNEAYLKEWAIVVAEWIREGLHPYVFIHAPNEFYAPRIARRFHTFLADLIDLNPMPKWPAQRAGPEGQMSLFE